MLLALMPLTEREALLDRLELRQFTGQTLTDRKTISAELDIVAREGIAHDPGELDPDVRCIAVAVHDFSGRPAAALGISGPAWRMAGAQLAGKRELLHEAAQELSSRLGASGQGQAGR